MSKTDRPTLDFFLLALMDDGATVTPYDLLRRLGISPGASIPALKRLQEQGLVKSEPAGPRRRRVFKASNQGKRLLWEMQDVLRREVKKVPLDTESISRILALCYGPHGGVGLAVQLVEAAMEKCLKKMAEAQAKLPPLEAKCHRGSTEETYLWVLTTLDVARWHAQAAGLKRLYYRMVTRGYRVRKGMRPPLRRRVQKPQ